MSRPTPLSPELLLRPFTVAEARALGVPRSALAGRSLRAPHRGVRVPATLPDTLEVRCAAARLALPPQAAFCGVTAAQLCDLPLPPAARGGDLWVRVPAGATVPQVEGVLAGEGLREAQVWRGHEAGLRVVHPVDTWCDLAPELPFDDAVALGDAVRRRWARDGTLAAAVQERSGRPGVVRLRRLLLWVRFPVDSPMETRLRLLLLRGGIPEPVCGARVLGTDGGWLSCPDLSWPRARVAAEYDGETHRLDRQQWRDDIARKELMEDHGWRTLVFTADDVLRRPAITVARVRAALTQRGLPC